VHTLGRYEMVGSMGRVGAAGDNAAMESFSSLLQKNIRSNHDHTGQSGRVTETVTYRCSRPPVLPPRRGDRMKKILLATALAASAVALAPAAHADPAYNTPDSATARGVDGWANFRATSENCRRVGVRPVVFDFSTRMHL
jgi:hypothetical protein